MILNQISLGTDSREDMVGDNAVKWLELEFVSYTPLGSVITSVTNLLVSNPSIYL